MIRSRTLWLLLLLLASLSWGLWWVVKDGPGAAVSPGLELVEAVGGPGPGASTRAPDGLQSGGAGERSPESPVGARRLGPLVRSATGLDLEQLELAPAGAPWGPATLEEGRLLVSSTGSLERVRARGHLATPIDEGDEVVELQPVASLVLRGQGARERIALVELGLGRDEAARARLARAGHWGLSDDDTWVLALDPGEEWAQLRARFELRDGTELRVEARFDRGVRVEVPLPEERSALELLPLEVEVRGASSPVHLTVDAKARLDRGRVRSPEGGELATWEHLRDPERSSFESTDGQFSLPGFERGRSFYLRAQAPAEGSEAGHSFLSDGERVVLVLSGGRLLRGRLATDGAPLPEHVDISWMYARSDGVQTKGIVAERTVLERIPIDPSGRFEVGVSDDWMWVGMNLDPDRLAVTFDASGFDARSVEVDLSGGERVHDLGVVLLSTRTPELVLRASTPDGGRHGASAVLCSPREPLVHHWVDCLLPSERGGSPVTEVYLQRMLDPSGAARYEFGRLRYSWGPLEDFAPAALVLLVGEQSWPFERAPDGTFLPVPTVTRAVELELVSVPAAATRLELAWSWRGLVVPLWVDGVEVLTTLDAGDVRTLELLVPENDVELLAQFSKRRENDGAVQLLGERHRLSLVDGRLRLQLP